MKQNGSLNRSAVYGTKGLLRPPLPQLAARQLCTIPNMRIDCQTRRGKRPRASTTHRPSNLRDNSETHRDALPAFLATAQLASERTLSQSFFPQRSDVQDAHIPLLLPRPFCKYLCNIPTPIVSAFTASAFTPASSRPRLAVQMRSSPIHASSLSAEGVASADRRRRRRRRV